jgi:hypothetical protein
MSRETLFPIRISGIVRRPAQSEEEIDVALVGGASLEPKSFAAIVEH